MMKVWENQFESLHLEFFPGDRVFLFGDLAAGKTTLVRFCMRQLGITEAIKSPTFNYYSQYQWPKEQVITHFDLYRVHSYELFIAIGWEELFDDSSMICFVEWPEIIKNKFSPSVEIFLKKLPNDERSREIIVVRRCFPENTKKTLHTKSDFL